jgi:hypothetical protein
VSRAHSEALCFSTSCAIFSLASSSVESALQNAKRTYFAPSSLFSAEKKGDEGMAITPPSIASQRHSAQSRVICIGRGVDDRRAEEGGGRGAGWCEGARVRGCEDARVRGCEGARVGGWVGGAGGAVRCACGAAAVVWRMYSSGTLRAEVSAMRKKPPCPSMGTRPLRSRPLARTSRLWRKVSVSHA